MHACNKFLTEIKFNQGKGALIHIFLLTRVLFQGSAYSMWTLNQSYTSFWLQRYDLKTYSRSRIIQTLSKHIKQIQDAKLPKLTEFICWFNPFYATDLFLYTLKIMENLWYSDVFSGYKKKAVTWNGLMVGRWSIKVMKYHCTKREVFH